MGEVQITWVKDNTFIILVPDESSARNILTQVPWAVMKKTFRSKDGPKI